MVAPVRGSTGEVLGYRTSGQLLHVWEHGSGGFA